MCAKSKKEGERERERQTESDSTCPSTQPLTLLFSFYLCVRLKTYLTNQIGIFQLSRPLFAIKIILIMIIIVGLPLHLIRFQFVFDTISTK